MTQTQGAARSRRRPKSSSSSSSKDSSSSHPRSQPTPQATRGKTVECSSPETSKAPRSGTNPSSASSPSRVSFGGSRSRLSFPSTWYYGSRFWWALSVLVVLVAAISMFVMDPMRENSSGGGGEENTTIWTRFPHWFSRFFATTNQSASSSPASHEPKTTRKKSNHVSKGLKSAGLQTDRLILKTNHTSTSDSQSLMDGAHSLRLLARSRKTALISFALRVAKRYSGFLMVSARSSRKSEKKIIVTVSPNADRVLLRSLRSNSTYTIELLKKRKGKKHPHVLSRISITTAPSDAATDPIKSATVRSRFLRRRTRLRLAWKRPVEQGEDHISSFDIFLFRNGRSYDHRHITPSDATWMSFYIYFDLLKPAITRSSSTSTRVRWSWKIRANPTEASRLPPPPSSIRKPAAVSRGILAYEGQHAEFLVQRLSSHYNWTVSEYGIFDSQSSLILVPSYRYLGPMIDRIPPHVVVNHFSIAQQIHDKEQLQMMLESKYPPLILDEFVPRTILIRTNDTWERLNSFRCLHQQESCPVIVKPTYSSQGNGIRVFSNASLAMDFVFGPAQSRRNASEPFSVQQYIDNPMLVNGYKFDIRQHVLVMSLNPLVVLVNDDFVVRFSSEKYVHGDYENSRVHLTNSAINFASDSGKEAPPSAASLAAGVTARRSEPAKPVDDWAMRHIERLFKTLYKISFRGQVYKHYLDVIERTLRMLPPSAHRDHTYELFGFDIMFDDKFRPYLLEVNQGPQFGQQTRVKRAHHRHVADTIIRLILESDVHIDTTTCRIMHKNRPTLRFGKFRLFLCGEERLLQGST